MSQAPPPIDILSPGFVTDPGPMIDRMLAEAPVAFDGRVQGWLVGGYGAFKDLEREPRLSSQRQGYVSALLPEPLRERIRGLEDWYGGWMVMRDGADHLRLRRLAAPAFQPLHLKRLEARIEAIVDELLAPGLARGEIEVISELAYPLPSIVICELVGMPRSDMGLFTRWVQGMNALLAATLSSAEAIDRVGESRREMHGYFSALIAERRRAPLEGELLSQLVAGAEAGDALTEDEVIDLVALIMSGAYETTANLIGNGLYLLLSDPGQLAAVQADPSLVAAWVEETLRLEPSVALNTRAVVEGFDYRGQRFDAGQMVYFLAIAANRDGAKFPDPHRFDVARPNCGEHVTFGFGPHFCIGAPLARMEARCAFRALLRQAPGARLAEQEIRRVPNMVVRGFERISVLTG